MEFRCVNSYGEDLCFNGGVCTEIAGDNVTRSRQICVCPSGEQWTADYEWFHFPNCVRNVDSTKYALIEYAVLGGIISVALARELAVRLRSSARKIGALTVAFILTAFITLLSMELQKGCYESCAFFGNLGFILADILMATIILTVMKPLFSLQKADYAKFRNIIVGWTTAMVMGSAVVMIAMEITCRDVDPSNYNLAALLGSLILWFSGITLTSFSLIAGYRLESQIAQVCLANNIFSSNSDKIKGLVRRIRVLRCSLFVTVPPFVVLIIAVPVTIHYLSFFPYFYVCVYLTSNFVIVSGAGILIFLRQNKMGLEDSGSRVGDTGQDTMQIATLENAVIPAQATTGNIT